VETQITDASEIFSIEMKVRDYELDMQGIVNNGVYFNYLEHARHEYMLSKNIDVAGLAKQGINLVVVRSELDYNSSLYSGDLFRVSVKPERVSKVKFGFRQQVIRSHDAKVCVDAFVIGTALSEKGRPFVPEWLNMLPPNKA
jgi:acyl-CoA thioester hydrolase